MWMVRRGISSILRDLRLAMKSWPVKELIYAPVMHCLWRIYLWVLMVHNVEMKPGKGGQLARCAGTGIQIAAKEGKYVHCKMPSSEVRLIDRRCMATIGVIGNSENEGINKGKAGVNRWRGKRPHVRGVAMNPVDHPMGGGEGRTSGGRHPCTPWGKPTKGFKTRKKRKASDKFIVKGRKR